MTTLIDKRYPVRLPNGEIKSVNIFDYNLKSCIENAIIQLDDTSWNYVRNLELVSVEVNRQGLWRWL